MKRFSVFDININKDIQSHYKPMSYDLECFDNSYIHHNSFYDKFLKDIRKETKLLNLNKHKDRSPQPFKPRNPNFHSNQLKQFISRQSLDLREVKGKFNNLNKMSLGLVKDRDKDKDNGDSSNKGSPIENRSFGGVENKKAGSNQNSKLVVVHQQKKMSKERNEKENSIEEKNKSTPKDIKKNYRWLCCIPIYINDSKIKTKADVEFR